jgi:hypothetical protein
VGQRPHFADPVNNDAPAAQSRAVPPGQRSLVSTPSMGLGIGIGTGQRLRSCERPDRGGKTLRRNDQI